MKSTAPQPDRLRATFSGILNAIVAGDLGGCPSDTGLDDETVNALDALANVVAQGGYSDALLSAVTAEFAAMLDGTHAREAREQTLAYFRQLDQRHTPGGQQGGARRGRNHGYR